MMKPRISALLGLALSVISASAAAAADKAEGSNLFAGDFGNVFWTLLIFGLVLVVLGRFAWGPILDNLQAREEFIHASLAKAAEDRDRAEARLSEYEERLNEARAEATAIVEEGRRDAEVLRQRIEQEVQAESDQMVARSKREIEIAKETAIKELYTASGEMATEIASRILGQELDSASHQKLIAEAIAELESMPPVGSVDSGQPS